MIEITIQDITGATPYNIYLCDELLDECFWISEVNSFPYTFIVPPPFNTLEIFCVKAIDSNNCEIIDCKTI